jgi:hypothetical protein
VFVSTTDEPAAANIRLAYTFVIDDYRIYVDATTGKVIKSFSLIQNCFGHAHGEEHHAGAGQAETSPVLRPVSQPLLQAGTFVHLKANYPGGGQRQQTIETDAAGSGFRLTASGIKNDGTTRGQALWTRFDGNGNRQFDENDAQDPTFANTTNNWGTAQQAATTAHWTAYQTYQYFRSLGLNGLDGDGTICKILIAPTFQNNARFLPTNTGGTFIMGSLDNGVSLATLDITAHEYGHGISRFLVSGINDNDRDGLRGSVEARALNEGFSDIIGTAVERRLMSEWNWTMGEDLGETGLIRNLSDPGLSGGRFGTQTIPPQPEIYLGANWDLGGQQHTNAGVLSKWFFTVSDGRGPTVNGQVRRVTPIGFDAAMSIVYHTLEYFLFSNSGYEDVRNASVRAAATLYGECSPTQKSVAAAWRAVGIDGPDCSNDCNYELTGLATVNATCNQPMTLSMNCNSLAGGACNNISYGFTDQDGNFVGPGNAPTVTVTAPTGAGVFTYRAALTKNGCHPKAATFTVNVNCAPTTTNDCAAFTVGTVVGYGINNPALGVMVGFDGTCKRAMWANGSGATPLDWKPHVVPTGNFTTASINQCLRFEGEACTGGSNPTPTPTPTPTTRCAAFTNGTAIGYRTGNPGVAVVVQDDGVCRKAIWSNGDGQMHPNWIPYTTFSSSFSMDDIRYCLTFDSEACKRPARIAAPTDEAAAKDNELVAYPNPASDVLTVNWGYALPANTTFTLTDVLGRTHETASRLTIVGGQRIRLSVRHLPAGVYVLRIGAVQRLGEGNRPRTVRFVKD